MGMAELDPERHRDRGETEWAKLKRELIDACAECGGSGQSYGETEWEDDLIPSRKARMCRCKATALFRMTLHEAGLPREFWQADEIAPEFNEDQFSIVDRYAEKLHAARRHGLGLVLTGRNGAGKTTCGARIGIAAARAGYSVSYINFPHLVDGWRRAWKEPALAKYLDERVCADFVILDEIGKEHATRDETFVVGKLDGILRMRRGDLYPTILITNLETSEFVETYGESLGSLLADRFHTLRFKPGDFRKRGNKRSWSSLLNEGE